MTRYARYKGNTHRQEHEATDWAEMTKKPNKIERTENRRLKRQEDKKGLHTPITIVLYELFLQLK